MKFQFLFAFLLLATSAIAEEMPAFKPEQIEFFEKKIRPVLAEQCFKCHSETGEKIKGGLVLDSRGAMLKGGDSGPALVAGDPGKSLIIQAIRYIDEDLQMPPKHRLSSEQVADFEQWVKMGVPDPRAGTAPPAAYALNLEEGRKFWSFQPVQDPTVPAVQMAGWARNDVDRFVLAKLEAKQLAPSPDVDRLTLLRRITFDLTGLPPTPEEVREFAGNPAPDAYAQVVDRLLASPAYGERWGRHWLDIARYADTSGCNSDFPIPSAHRYRDYVVNAFNQDKPYDQFLREQIAGDLLPSNSNEERFEKIVATGYLAIARRFGSRANEFHLTIEDLIDNLGKATLGLSVSCARCHDHKFDPVLNKDYYALYGIFESSRFAFPGTEIYRHTKDFVPLVADQQLAQKYLAEGRELAGLDDRIENLKNEKKRLAREEKEDLQKAPAAAEQVSLEPERIARIRAELEAKAAASRRSADEPELLGPPLPPLKLVAAVKTKRTAADAQRDLDAAMARQAELVENADAYPKAYAVMEGQPRDTRIQRKGEPGNKGDEVPRGFLTVLGAQTLPAEEKGSGRRELAEWVADAKNPLTARVMVNRIWQGHFGRGLVRTPNDFGVRGERPTHPELLDWLASRFVESGWSIKAMHRLMVLSRAYQMSSDERPEAVAIDNNNDLFWRFNRRRLSAEEVRDSFLAIAGTLDRGPAGPHPFRPEKEWRYTQHKPFVADYDTKKRSIYLMQQRIKKQPFLEVFDGADTNASTAVRPISHTPIQALWMMNSGLAHEQSMALAERLETTFSDESARIGYVFELAFARPAAHEEIEQGQAYLREISETLRDTAVAPELQPRTALASFARVLLSSNEFLFVE